MINHQNKNKTISTLENIFNNKTNLESELSLKPISINMDDVKEFVDLFYEKNISDNIALLFIPELLDHGGVSAEFDAYLDITNGSNYFAIVDINISNNKRFSFLFFIAHNSLINNTQADIDIYMDTDDLNLFINAFFIEYSRVKELIKSMINN